MEWVLDHASEQAAWPEVMLLAVLPCPTSAAHIAPLSYTNMQGNLQLHSYFVVLR